MVKAVAPTRIFFSYIWTEASLLDGEIFAVQNPHQDSMSTPSTELLFVGLSYALLVVNLKNLENLIFFALITLITPCDGTRVRLSFFFLDEPKRLLSMYEKKFAAPTRSFFP